jgi:hypothetical protein
LFSAYIRKVVLDGWLSCHQLIEQLLGGSGILSSQGFRVAIHEPFDFIIVEAGFNETLLQWSNTHIRLNAKSRQPQQENNFMGINH